MQELGNASNVISRKQTPSSAVLINMAASRCITSLLRSPNILSHWSASPFQRLVGSSSRIAQTKWNYCNPPSCTLGSASRSQQWRFFSQQAGSDSSSSSQPSSNSAAKKPSSTPILGSLSGLGGIAGEIKPAPSRTPEEEQAEDEARRKKEAESSWRALKYSMIFVGVTFGGLAGFLVATWGAPDRDEEGNKIEDQFSSKPLPLQYLLRSWNGIRNYSQVSFCLPSHTE